VLSLVPKATRETVFENGTGDALRDIASVAKSIRKHDGDDTVVKKVHQLLYSRPGKVTDFFVVSRISWLIFFLFPHGQTHETKKNILRFNGLPAKGKKEGKERFHSRLTAWKMNDIRAASKLFLLDAGAPKDELVDALVDFLAAPKTPKKVHKKKSTKKKPSKKKTTTTSESEAESSAVESESAAESESEKPRGRKRKASPSPKRGKKKTSASPKKRASSRSRSTSRSRSVSRSRSPARGRSKTKKTSTPTKKRSSTPKRKASQSPKRRAASPSPKRTPTKKKAASKSRKSASPSPKKKASTKKGSAKKPAAKKRKTSKH